MSLRADVLLHRPWIDLDISIESEPGEVVAVLGPNGSGKTTLLRCLAGIETPDTARILVGDSVITDTSAGIEVPPPQRSVGFVFQDYLLFPHLRVADNIAFGLRSRGASKSDADQRTHEWLDRLDLSACADRLPRELSGGLAQRVALARALITEPELLLLDEPLAALDSATRSHVRSVLRRHLASFAGAVVLVTHDPVDMMVLADRVLVVDAGRVVQRGTPAEIARRPASQYVASLVGVNLLRGTARDGLVRLAAGGEVHVSAEGLTGEVVVAIRPQAVALHTEHPSGSPRNVWRGTVTGLEARADHVLVTVDAGPPLTVAVTPAAVAELRLGEGHTVWMSLKATDLEVYPA